MASQFMFLAAISHDFESVGHRSTVRTVSADPSHDENDDTFKYLNQVCVYIYIHIYVYIYTHTPDLNI